MREESKIAINIAAVGYAIAVFASPTIVIAAPLSAHIELGDHGFGFRSIGFRASSVLLTITNQGSKPHALALSNSGSSQPVLTETKDLVSGTVVSSRAVDSAGQLRFVQPSRPRQLARLGRADEDNGADLAQWGRDGSRVLQLPMIMPLLLREIGRKEGAGTTSFRNRIGTARQLDWRRIRSPPA